MRELRLRANVGVNLPPPKSHPLSQVMFSVIEDSTPPLASISAYIILCTLMSVSHMLAKLLVMQCLKIGAKTSVRKHHVKHPWASLNYLCLTGNSAN